MPIVKVPDRTLKAGLAAKVAVADPAVVPLAGEMLIQLGSVTDAVHDPPLHPDGPALLMVNCAVPPEA
jgi:hypothetical protein